MTSASDETTPERPASDQPGITDEQLPEDLQPGEDNPLAEPLPDGESADLGIPESGERGAADEDADDADADADEND